MLVNHVSKTRNVGKGSVKQIIIFHNAHCMHQTKCKVRTDSTIVYTFSDDSYSNISSRIKVIGTCMCTLMEKTGKLFDDPVITFYSIIEAC